jgi:hypothetical protein
MPRRQIFKSLARRFAETCIIDGNRRPVMLGEGTREADMVGIAEGCCRRFGMAGDPSYGQDCKGAYYRSQLTLNKTACAPGRRRR